MHCYCLYLKMKYNLRRCVWMPFWQVADLWLLILCVSMEGVLDVTNISVNKLWVKQITLHLWVSLIKSVEDLARTKLLIFLSKTEFSRRLPSDFSWTINNLAFQNAGPATGSAPLALLGLKLVSILCRFWSCYLL